MTTNQKRHKKFELEAFHQFSVAWFWSQIPHA